MKLVALEDREGRVIMVNPVMVGSLRSLVKADGTYPNRTIVNVLGAEHVIKDPMMDVVRKLGMTVESPPERPIAQPSKSAEAGAASKTLVAANL